MTVAIPQRENSPTAGRPSRALQETVVRHLLMVRDANDGRVPRSVYRYWAGLIGVHMRTLQAWVSAGELPARERPSFAVDDRYRELFFDCRGNVSRVQRRALQEGLEPPSRATLCRAFAEAIRPAERAYARSGEKAFQELTPHVHRAPEHRWSTVELDFGKSGVKVVLPRHKKSVELWVCFGIDTSTKWVHWVMGPHHTKEMVLAVMRKFLTRDPETGVGGQVQHWRWDNGSEFISNAVTSAAAEVDSLPLRTDIYAPWQKGSIERFIRTFKEELLGELPGWQAGPRTRDGDLIIPPEGVLSADRFVEVVRERVRFYNEERPHSALDGRAPLQAYGEDPTPVELVSDDKLRRIGLPAVQRKVLHDGIHHDTWVYIAPELTGLGGEKVEVRYMPHDREWVEVWRNGSFLCRATLQEHLSEREREEVLGERRQMRDRAERETRRAAERARRRYAPASDSELLQETTTAQDEDGEVSRRRRLADARKAAERRQRESATDVPLTLPDAA